MKNEIALSLFALTVSAYALPASAQSSMTLYGILDNSLQYINNSHGKGSQIGLADSNGSADRWGFLGKETLSHDLTAVFDLENGYNLNTGAFKQGGRMFGRQAYVGLASKQFGTVTMGRQYDALKDLVLPLEGDVWLTPGDVDDAYASIRMSNVVKWASPDHAPLRAVFTYSFGGVAGSVGSGQTYSAALGYTFSNVKIAAGYLHIDNGNAASSIRGTTTADSLYSSVINSAYVSATSIDIARTAADYTFGPFSFLSYLSLSRYAPDGASTFKTPEFYRNGSIIVGWRIAPPINIRLAYQRLQSNGDSKANYNQLTLAANYAFSKRTDVYIMETFEHASGSNGLGPAQAVVSDTAITGTASVILSIIGLRHRF